MQAAISSPVPPLGSYSGRDIYQVCAYLDPEDEHLVEEIAGDCVMTRWAFGGMDIIARGGGKVTGIRRYLDRLGIRPEETIAFGDGDRHCHGQRLGQCKSRGGLCDCGDR